MASEWIAEIAMSRSFLIACGLLILLSSCRFIESVPASSNELVGEYVTSYDIAEEVLTLKKDGTFQQKVTIESTGESRIANGTWVYDADDGDIYFKGIMNVVGADGKLDPHWSSQDTGGGNVVKEFGRITIASSKAGWPYEKE